MTPTGSPPPAPEFSRIAPDVRLGTGVRIHGFVNLYGCEIGDGSQIGTFVEIQKNARVGKRCKVSTHAFVCEGVTIEDECFIGHHVVFINDRYPHAANPDGSLQTDADWTVVPTRVGRRASIGSGAVILCGVTIGEGALVGAGSVVTKDVPAFAVVAGNPARVVRRMEGAAVSSGVAVETGVSGSDTTDPQTIRFGVVIPAYNEPRLSRLLEKFDFGVTPDVVVVDDGSTDDSTAITSRYPVTLLRHERRTGVGAALRTGVAYLREKGFDLAVIMAGNNKDDPADIPVLLDAIRRGADYVQGSRYLEPERARDTPLGRRLITRSVAWLWSVRFMRVLTDVTNGFRAYRLSLLDDPRIDMAQEWLNRYELEYYLHYKVLSLGYRYREVPVWKRYPTDGMSTSKIKLARDCWSLLRPLVLLTLRLRT